MKQGRYSNDERRLYTHVQEDSIFLKNNNNNKYQYVHLDRATPE